MRGLSGRWNDMSNVQLVRGLYEAFSKGDVPGVLAAFGEDVVWTEAEGFPTGGTYVGADAVVAGVFMPLVTDWEGFTVKPAEFLDAGDAVVAVGQYSGVYKQTGKSMTVPFAHIWRIADGKVRRFDQFTDTLVVSRALQG